MFKFPLNVQAPLFYSGSKYQYKYNIFAQIFRPVLCQNHCQDFVGNFGCNVCYYSQQELYVKTISDNDVGCKLWVNAHKTDYNSICSKESG